MKQNNPSSIVNALSNLAPLYGGFIAHHQQPASSSVTTLIKMGLSLYFGAV